MVVRYTGESDPLTLINGKEYEVVGIEEGWYRVIYPPEGFEIVSGTPDEFAADSEQGKLARGN